jgi:hypothetical protein
MLAVPDRAQPVGRGEPQIQAAAAGIASSSCRLSMETATVIWLVATNHS